MCNSVPGKRRSVQKYNTNFRQGQRKKPPLAEVNTQATERLERIMEQLIREWDVSEDLKARDQMGWVHVMNGARCSADEIVKHELIYC